LFNLGPLAPGCVFVDPELTVMAEVKNMIINRCGKVWGIYSKLQVKRE
jgi:hypothetical protein